MLNIDVLDLTYLKDPEEKSFFHESRIKDDGAEGDRGEVIH